MDKNDLTPDGVVLKDATRQLLDKCGGAEFAARLTRVGKSNLYEYQKPERPELFMPLDVVRDLERVSGSDCVTQALAFLSGGYLVRPARKTELSSVMKSLPDIGRGTGELFARMGRAVADGSIDAREAADIKAEAQECMTALLCLLNAIGQGA